MRLIPSKKDIAFVEYADEGSAGVAKDALHNYKLDGENKIKVSLGFCTLRFCMVSELGGTLFSSFCHSILSCLLIYTRANPCPTDHFREEVKPPISLSPYTFFLLAKSELKMPKPRRQRLCILTLLFQLHSCMHVRSAYNEPHCNLTRTR